MGISSGLYPPGDFTFTAGFWKLLGAKLFGTKFDEQIGRYHVVAYYWRGTYYFTRYDAL